MERYQYSLNLLRFNIINLLIASAIPIKIPMAFWVEIEKLILKCTWNYKGPEIVKNKFEKNKVGGHRLSDFRTYYKL